MSQKTLISLMTRLLGFLMNSLNCLSFSINSFKKRTFNQKYHFCLMFLQYVIYCLLLLFRPIIVGIKDY